MFKPFLIQLPQLTVCTTLASEPCFLVVLPLSFVVSVFLSFAFLLLDSSELCVFLAFAPGILLSSSEFKSCPSFATPNTDTKVGSTRELRDSSWMAFCSCFSFFSGKEPTNVLFDPGFKRCTTDSFLV